MSSAIWTSVGPGVLFVLAKLLDRLRFRLGVQSNLFRASAVHKWGVETIRRVSAQPAHSVVQILANLSFSSTIKDTIRFPETRKSTRCRLVPRQNVRHKLPLNFKGTRRSISVIILNLES